MIRLTRKWNLYLNSHLPLIILTILIFLLAISNFILPNERNIVVLGISLPVWIFVFKLVQENIKDFNDEKQDLELFYKECEDNLNFCNGLYFSKGEAEDKNRYKNRISSLKKKPSLHNFSTIFIKKVIEKNRIKNIIKEHTQQ